MFNGKDERVPVAGLAWGVEVLDAIVHDISTQSTRASRSSIPKFGV